MKKLSLVATSLLAAFITGACTADTNIQAKPAVSQGTAKKLVKPNVLFIAVDDLRVQYGPYDFDKAITPNIDRLVNQGVAFTQAYSNVPVCGASRASMLTGVRPTINRFVAFESADKVAPWAPSIAKVFSDNGYTTYSLGKIFNNLTDHANDWSEFPWRPEGAKNEDSTSGNKKQASLLSRHDYVTSDGLAMAEKGIKNHPAFEKADVVDDVYKNGKIAKRAISDLKRLKKAGKPFFLAVGLKKPHLPFNAPSKYWDLYDESTIELTKTPLKAKNSPSQSDHNWNELRNYGHDGAMPKKGKMPDEMARKLIHGYHAATSYSDALIGNILTELESLGLEENTIVVLWGDHGWSLGEHTHWAKHSSYDVTNHIPLIIKVPGMTNGEFAKGLVESVDIFPTLTQLAGLPAPSSLQGDSLVPMLKNPQATVNDAVFPRWKNADSIRTQNYMYTEWRNKKNNKVIARMLFDHRVDPRETINVAEDFKYAQVVVDLHNQLVAHIAQIEK
ncbi:sulfatase [Colwellia sp. 75C3]|uniref:sulfatase n=1 Tax=Colwellia sp. 75C3 TaxID=888425 RepID=UPI0012FEB6CF|nr:sulfatase [Colwellia sp. 75C3]